MAFRKGTTVLTMDGWMRVENLVQGDKLWGGGGIHKVKKVYQSLAPLVKISSKQGFSLVCTGRQLLELPDDNICSAEKCLGHELEYIQMGEQNPPMFTKLTKIKESPCFDIEAEGGFYVGIGEDTGIYIVPYL